MTRLNLPFSASNIAKFAQCPRLFQAQYVTKTLVVRYDSAPALRGIVLHGMLEYTLTNGFTEQPFEVQVNKTKRMVSWPDYAKEWTAIRPLIELVQGLKIQGWDVQVEKELTIGRDGSASSWWAGDCLARAKADILLVTPERSKIIIIDLKTGKAENINPFQFPLMLLILAREYGAREFSTMDYLIDYGQTPIKDKMFSPGPLTDALQWDVDVTPAKFLPTLSMMRDLNQAYIDNNWPATPNNKCKWCEVGRDVCVK